MASPDELPRIEELKAIAPANSGKGDPELVYETLPVLAEDYREGAKLRENNFWDSQMGSLDEEDAAYEFARQGLVFTADKLVAATGRAARDRWSRLYTRASVELYGMPDKQETQTLIARQQKWLQGLVGNDGVSQDKVQFLLSVYEGCMDGANTHEADDREAEKRALDAYADAIRAKYQPMFDKVSQDLPKKIEGPQLRQIFQESLDWLIENDDKDWQDWQVINDKEGTTPQVNPNKKVIIVPDGSTPTTRSNLVPLLTHELLVHALRSKNGYKTSDSLGRGLPGLEEREEGFAIMAEQAIKGKPLHRHSDRYIDIALALGIPDGHRRSRQELYEIAYARWVIRSQRASTYNPDDDSDVQRKAWNRVDRIYRGGPGDSDAGEQAIYTKDAIYYSGYKKALRYLMDRIESGDSAEEIFAYVSQGKFDPTRTDHTEMVAA